MLQTANKWLNFGYFPDFISEQIHLILLISILLLVFVFISSFSLIRTEEEKKTKWQSWLPFLFSSFTLSTNKCLSIFLFLFLCLFSLFSLSLLCLFAIPPNKLLFTEWWMVMMIKWKWTIEIANSVCHGVKDVDFLIVVLIVRDVRRIVIVVANLHYCIGWKMRASI